MNSYKIFLLFLIPIQGWGQGNFLRFLPSESGIIQTIDCKSARLTFQIKEGFYIQADKVLNDNFIPTQLKLELNLATDIQKILYPKVEILLLGGIEEAPVFQGKIEVWIEFDSWSVIPVDQIKGSLLYQACNKQKCFFPRKLTFQLPPSNHPKLLMP